MAKKQPYLNAVGEKVPSVTEIIKGLGWNTDQLMGWANKIGREGKTLNAERTKLADAGSLAHLMVSHDIRDEPPPDLAEYDAETRESALACYASYQRWRQERQIRLISSEVRLVSELYQVGGTLDALAMEQGGLTLFDWKSAKAVYAETIIQCSAYEKIWNENNPDMPIQKVKVMRWRPEGAEETHIPILDRVRAWEIFTHLLPIHALKGTLEVAA